MPGRAVLGAVLGCALLAGCSSGDDLWSQDPLDSPDFGIPVGSMDDCRLEDSPPGDNQNLAWPVHQDSAPSMGTLDALVVFVDFPNALGAESPDDLINAVTDGVAEFYDQVSYGSLDVQFEHHPEWVTMEYRYQAYSWEGARWDGFISEVVEAADPEVDFAGTHALIIVTPPGISYFDGGIAGMRTWYWGWQADHYRMTNAITLGDVLWMEDRLVLVHEIGHVLGLPDLYETADLGSSRYVGDFGVMGDDYGRAPEFFAYERWLLGWLEDDQVRCVDGEHKAALTAVELGEGISAVMVRTGPSTVVVVESRRPIGHDSDLRVPGVLVYRVDSSIPSGEGPIRLVPPYSRNWDDVVLEPGERVEIDGVEVMVFEADNTADIIGIRVLAPRDERVP